jgi:tetratricopeptide (TPR) repeat protein
MVLGFAALTRIDIDEAKAAFERAIALDSANPLPRLGLGLAKIRQSDLEERRHEIEIAAGLDPNNSLIRSYLGKAYFEERRDPQAGEQYTIAKELDPNDPTPWFYDAIRLQLDNRPVQALRELEKSIELNDNRAVYRSRLLLDEDHLGRRAPAGAPERNQGRGYANLPGDPGQPKTAIVPQQSEQRLAGGEAVDWFCGHGSRPSRSMRPTAPTRGSARSSACRVARV